MTQSAKASGNERVPFLFLGDDPAVDFANTRYKPDAEWVEALDSSEALEAWVRQAGFDAGEIRSLQSRGTSVLTDVRLLRDEWRTQLERLVARRKVAPEFLERLNALLAEDRYCEQIEALPGGGYCRGRTKPEAGGSPLLFLARAIVRFLADRDLDQLRKCANPECVLFFFDTSKNHRRQWCSQQTCGNRAKVAAFRARQARQSGGGRGRRK